MSDSENAVVALGKLHDMGLQVSMDDFGTGYSSLSYLKRYPIDTIKIDHSFVADIATSDDDAEMIGLDLGQHHRDGLRVFVLQVVGQYGFVNVAQLVPHGATGRAADFFHDLGDAIFGQGLIKQAFRSIICTNNRATATAGKGIGEFNEKLLDNRG